MGFEEEIKGLASQEAERLANMARFREQYRVEAHELVTGIIAMLQERRYEPVPIFVETRYKKALILWDTQHHERAGEGWYLRHTGEDGYDETIVISTKGEIATQGTLSAPTDRPVSYGGTLYKGLPRRGSHIRCSGLKRPERIAHYAAQAIRATAMELEVYNPPQIEPGRVDTRRR